MQGHTEFEWTLFTEPDWMEKTRQKSPSQWARQHLTSSGDIYVELTKLQQPCEQGRMWWSFPAFADPDLPLHFPVGHSKRLSSGFLFYGWLFELQEKLYIKY